MAKGKSSGGSRGLPVSPKTDAARQRMWAAESALGTLRRAGEIQRDPKLMADARALAAREQAALAKITKAK
ncbi:MAG TPA: hypothetical protein VL614_14955 [Acetobacteraceae bacterium]|nr:hypothetical protein [Acetobacteraceae bacterium]